MNMRLAISNKIPKEKYYTKKSEANWATFPALKDTLSGKL